jgi:hypothetical protein
MHSNHTTLVALAAASLLALGTTCRETPNAPAADGVVQTVRLEPAEPRKGEIVTVVSTIENRGPDAKPVTYLVCVLGLGGELALTMPPDEARCAAVSATTDLAPGQRVEMRDRRVVASEPGVYALRVEHLVDPQGAITLQVRVRD